VLHELMTDEFADDVEPGTVIPDAAPAGAAEEVEQEWRHDDASCAAR
jgi:hypothetical protein